MTGRTPGRPRFGVRIAGVAVALPEGVPLAYLDRVAVLPLPGAAPAVVGLTQIHSHPVVVVDPGGGGGGILPSRCPVLVVGEAPDVAGLVVDGPPVPLALGASREGVSAPPCAFARLLADPVSDAADDGVVWWSVHPVELCRLLVSGEGG